MKVSIIITTYKAEEWLRKVLVGFSVQSETDFEVVIADDGSTEATQKIVAEFQSKFNFPIQHIWQEDDGFQKCKILNKQKYFFIFLILCDSFVLPDNQELIIILNI